MTLSILFLFLCMAQSYAAKTYSHSTVVHIQKNTLTLQELIAEIETQTEFLFIFSRDDIDVERRLNVRTGSRQVDDLLGNAFQDSDITYTFIEQYITLRKMHEAERKAVAMVAQQSQQSQQTGKRITGTVVDAAGEPVIGANIIEKGTTNGIVTDVDGNFSLNVEDNAVLQISFVGYITQEISKLMGGGEIPC
jgi:hypothetical protein